MANVMPGHCYIDPKNHASAGTVKHEQMGGNGIGSEMTSKSMRLGGGGRFAALAEKTSPAIAASIGIKKYGKTKMAKWSAVGKKKG